MNQSYQTRLDFILKSHACTQVEFDEYAREDYPKMKQAITSLFLEILGEEENEYTTRGSTKYVGVRMGRNQLRAEIRKAIEETE